MSLGSVANVYMHSLIIPHLALINVMSAVGELALLA